MSLNGLDDAKIKEAHDAAVAEPQGCCALFGFLRYRRRSVLIKYVPADCSRLIQAAFHYILLRALHPPTSSLRRRRLMEIAEEAEEDIRAKRQSTVPEERPATAKAASIAGPAAQYHLLIQCSQASRQSHLRALRKPKRPKTSHLLQGCLKLLRSVLHGRASQIFSVYPTDLYSTSSYGSSRPKVKLGPRPSLDVGGRPHTSGATSHYRPVSTLPAGLKLFSKGSKSNPPSMTVSPPSSDTMPASQQTPRPHTSSANANINTPKTPAMTPEKARLMKAMELRKKQMSSTSRPPLPTEPTSKPAEDGLKNPTVESHGSSTEAPREVHDTLAMLDDMTKEDDSAISFGTHSTLKTDDSDAARSDSYPASSISEATESTDETVQEGHTTMPDKEDSEVPNASASSPTPTSEKIEEELLSEEGGEELPLEAKVEKDSTIQEPPSPSSVQLEGKRSDNVAQDINESTGASEGKSTPQFKASSIPTSSFNVAAREAASSASEVDAVPASPATAEAKEWRSSLATPLKTPLERTSSADTKKSLTEDDQENALVRKKTKRKGLIEPIRTDIDLTDRSAPNSVANFSSDDEFMEELEDAVFHEAKPISVSKSPISPVFPSEIPSPKKKEGNRFSRAFSSPFVKDTPSPALLSPHVKTESSRSVSASAAYLNRINQQPSQILSKKVNVGSGISQRIKALEKFSSASPSTTGAPATAPIASPAFFAVRPGSVRDSRSPSIAERASSLNRNSPSPNLSRESSPETLKPRERSGSIQNRLNTFNGSPNSSSMPAQRSMPESISVTARIIRDPSQPFPSKPEAGKDPSEYTPLDLKQSPLVIDHQKAVATPKETIKERRLSSSSKASKSTTTKERRSSITIVKDIISQDIYPYPTLLSPSRPPSTHTNGSPGFSKAMSIGRRSTSSRDAALSPAPTASSSSSMSDEKEKKSSRASRIMQRMSSSISSSRKTIAHAMSPTVREEGEPLASPSFQSSSTFPAITSTNIGDVNVQFPDSLLWKRRSMVLDSQGYLIAHAGAVRRYHLSTFRSPCIPDVEMQELPNSVVLDFVEGGGLQVACEDRSGQAQILTILTVLQEAHRTWAAYGQ
ncbi:hypothetical protein B0O99DRAFT_649148 [Bisporella sp. PMI_857]|nr:hypothetical protein B0O99DRAFT_649148 [Bisporella sp. PMI_857]